MRRAPPVTLFLCTVQNLNLNLNLQLCHRSPHQTATVRALPVMLSTLCLIDAAAVAGSSTASPSLLTLTAIQHTITAHPLILTPLFASLLLLLLLFFSPFLDRKRLPNEPPTVPSYLPFLGSALAFGSNPPAFLIACRARYGECFTVNLAGRRMTFVTSPLDYSTVFKHRELSFAVVANKFLREVLDHGEKSVGVAHIDHAIHAQHITHLSGDALDELTRNTHIQIRAWMKKDRAAHFTSPTTATSTEQQQYRQIGLRQWITDLAFEAGVQAVFGSGLDIPSLQPLFTAFDDAFPLLAGAPLLSSHEPVRRRAML